MEFTGVFSVAVTAVGNSRVVPGSRAARTRSIKGNNHIFGVLITTASFRNIGKSEKMGDVNIPQ